MEIFEMQFLITFGNKLTDKIKNTIAKILLEIPHCYNELGTRLQMDVGAGGMIVIQFRY